MRIIPFAEPYADAVKDLFTQLQTHLIACDDRNILVLKDTFREEYFRFAMRELVQNSGILLLAVEEDTVLGLISGYVSLPDEEDRITNTCPVRGHISDLVVSENARSQGVGSALMAEMERRFVAQNCDCIRISILAQNTSASDFYQSHGYRPTMLELTKEIKKQKSDL